MVCAQCGNTAHQRPLPWISVSVAFLQNYRELLSPVRTGNAPGCGCKFAEPNATGQRREHATSWKLIIFGLKRQISQSFLWRFFIQPSELRWIDLWSIRSWASYVPSWRRASLWRSETTAGAGPSKRAAGVCVEPSAFPTSRQRQISPSPMVRSASIRPSPSGSEGSGATGPCACLRYILWLCQVPYASLETWPFGSVTVVFQ
jgi:hypothetical protein